MTGKHVGDKATAGLGPMFLDELDLQIRQAELDLADAQARADEDGASVARARLADLADVVRRTSETPLFDPVRLAVT